MNTPPQKTEPFTKNKLRELFDWHADKRIRELIKNDQIRLYTAMILVILFGILGLYLMIKSIV